MKAQIITLSGILASASLLSAATNTQATSVESATAVQSSVSKSSMDRAGKNNASAELDKAYGRNDRKIGSQAETNQYDNDNIVTDAAGNNYFLPTSHTAEPDTGYGRHDRSVEKEIRSSTYEGRTELSDSLNTHLYYTEKSRHSMSKMRHSDTGKKDHMKSEQAVESWRNTVRSDLEALMSSSEENFEAAKMKLEKSFDGYSKANAASFKNFQTGAERTMSEDEMDSINKGHKRSMSQEQNGSSGIRNDRDYATEIRSSNYQNRSQLSRDLKSHAYDSEMMRGALSRTHSDVRNRPEYLESERKVQSWRDRMNADIQALENSTEETYDSAKKKLQKSFDGYSRANTEAFENFQTGSERAMDSK